MRKLFSLFTEIFIVYNFQFYELKKKVSPSGSLHTVQTWILPKWYRTS